MRALSAAQLLNAWERGLAQSHGQRALLLLTLACADTPPEVLARLSVGQRDLHLLNLRELLFGSRLASLVTCPACEETLELEMTVADLRLPPAGESAASVFAHNGYEVSFRVPNSLDLASLSHGADAGGNREKLVRSCLLSAQHLGNETAPEELPAEVVTALAKRMAEADPQADVQIALHCPQCAHEWLSPLDIATFLWSEIHAWAGRLLREVHALASAYGWRERDIVAMAPWRRHAYLEMIGQP
jgi:hypothetical protein